MLGVMDVLTIALIIAIGIAVWALYVSTMGLRS